ncbi:M28 family peptidase [Aduncisulcus paluster]|uniref:M28 family peptidase n=1 Tax=Aduncisulcus paluster TaxID=2918883 RepID=A0ABQ5JYW6_9EUKA|nr:M28 family peptidase [Aduncisulcus paluster]
MVSHCHHHDHTHSNPFKSYSDDVTRFPKEEREFAYSAYEAEAIGEICGPRLAGSKGCLKCASILSDLVRPVSDHVVLQPFTTQTTGFTNFFPALFVIFLIGVLASIPLTGIISIVVPFVSTFISFILFVVQFLFYGKTFDFLFKEKPCSNVIAIKDCQAQKKKEKFEKQREQKRSGVLSCASPSFSSSEYVDVHQIEIINEETSDETKEQKDVSVPQRTVLIGGHHDAAKCFTLLENDKLQGFYLICGMTPIFGMFIVMIFAIVALVLSFSNPSHFVVSHFSTIALSSGVLLLPALFFIHPYKISKGIGDNLACSVLCKNVMKYFDNKPCKNTRIIFVSSDAEEAGLRGMKAFVRKCLEEADKKKRGEAVCTEFPYHSIFPSSSSSSSSSSPNISCILFDSIYNMPDLAVLKSEVNGIVKADQNMVSSVVTCFDAVSKQEEQRGDDPFKVTVKPMPIGGGSTDAGVLSSLNIPAACVVGLPFSMVDTHYHTTRDTADKVDMRTMSVCAKMAIEYIEKVDRGEL